VSDTLEGLAASIGDAFHGRTGRLRKKNVRIYGDDDRVLLVAVGESSRRKIAGLGNRVFVWGSPVGASGLLWADTTAPPEPISFRRLTTEDDIGSFELFFDERLDLGALRINYRGFPGPRIDVQPRLG